MNAPDRPMRLGLFLQGAGHHVAGWRHQEAEFGGENLGLIQRIAATAEAGHFDLLFLADGLTTSADAHPSFVARLEPVALLSALAMGTRHIGLAATMSTTYTEPFHLARAFASLDHISGGRAAWNAVTTSYARSSANFMRGAHPSHDDRYAIAEEFIDVVRGLWDSFADDAFVKDKARGVYVEPGRVHTLNHQGQFFTVGGPLNVSRPPQGHPVIIQSGSSGPGQRLAARVGEIVFTAQQTLAEGRAFRDGLHALVREAGRDPAHSLVLPGVCPVIGGTEAEAKALYAQLQGGIDPAAAILLLSDRLGHDVSGCDLDGPLPDLPQSDQLQSRARLLTDLARRENLTLRELYHLVAGARGHRIVWGTPGQVADALEEWFRGGAADGFNIMPPSSPPSSSASWRMWCPCCAGAAWCAADMRVPRCARTWGCPARPTASSPADRPHLRGMERAPDYPRPPRLEPSRRRVRVILGGQVIVDSRDCWRVLETWHPPSWYIPAAAFAPGALVPAAGSSFCEWKGRARYLDLSGGGVVAPRAAWSYPDPTPAFAPVAGHVALYAGRVDACFVDEERVEPQPGGFYGGWITPDVEGPFKGAPGTQGW